MFYDADEKAVKSIMNDAIAKFNQNSVLLEKENIRSMYYGGQ